MFALPQAQSAAPPSGFACRFNDPLHDQRRSD